MANSSGQPEPDDASLETAEARMRRALGDIEAHGAGNGRASHEPARSRLEARASDRHTGDRPRARFVQDGDVPVTVLHRARPHEAEPLHGGSNRLSVAEAALASERTARSRAERALAEAQALVHDLQTKWGHAELARQELTGRLAAEREAFETERARLQAQEASLIEELAAERAARLRAETASAASGRPVRRREAASLPPDADTPSTGKPGFSLTGSKPSGRIGRPRLSGPRLAEPKPVKWWVSAPKTKS